MRLFARWSVLVLALALMLVQSASPARSAWTSADRLSFSSVAVEPVGPKPALFPHAVPFSQMTLQRLAVQQKTALSHYRYVFRHYLRWRDTLRLRPLKIHRTLPTPHVRCKTLGIVTPANYCWYASAADWTASELAKTKVKLAAQIEAASWPAHHALWLCIHGTPALGTEVGHEASTWDNADTGHNGHYGGLQMTPNWLGLISGTANNMTQLAQEQAAETGYRNSGFSRLWLSGQWGQTIAPCWKYA